MPRPALAAAFLLMALAATAPASADPSVAERARVLAPTGILRAAINLGNPVLAQPGPNGPQGVSTVLARDLAATLGVPLAFVTYDGAGRVTDAVVRQEWDVAFLAIDPVRGRELDYTAAYVVIGGSYAAAAGSSVRSLDEVDRAGVRVAVSGGSAYDLYLTRALSRATLLRLGSATAARDAVLAGTAEVLAGVRQQVEGFAAAEPRLRPLPGRFMAIEQAVAIPKGREAALPFLRAFVEHEKASGRVATALADSGQSAADAAPPAP